MFRRGGRRDSVDRERYALELHDNIVQGLAEAQLAFDLDRPDQARDAVDRTLAAARRMVTDLLGDVSPGALRRSAPADLPTPEQ